MRHVPSLAVAVLTGVCLSCAGSSPQRRPPVDSTPVNLAATPAARAVLAFLAARTTGAARGAVAGQNCGHGNQLVDASNAFVSYHALVDGLHDQSGKWVGMVGIDYEHDLIFRPEQLTEANAALLAHWQKGGLVTVNWAPQNPWLNDESDLTGNQGVWTNTRNMGNNLAHVDLGALVDPQSAIFPVWRRKLDRIAGALAELRDAGVVVLWRPMQEMNGDWFWWGYATYPGDGARYAAVWRDMYEYFTVEKGLDNLLWVYSPADGGGRPFSFQYPGPAYVDVVAPTYYGNALALGRWADALGFGKTVALAELGPTDHGAEDVNGTFDDRRYIQAIRDRYPEAAYFHAWHDWDWGDGTTAHKSLHANAHAVELLDDADVLTAGALPAWE